MDITQACNVPTPLTLGGREFPIRQLKLVEWGKIQSWLKTAYPSPVTQALKALQEAKEEGVTIAKDVEASMFRNAQEEARNWPPRVGSTAWFTAIDGIENGWTRVVQEIIQACGTKITLEEVESLMEKGTWDEMVSLTSMATYGDEWVPKAKTMPDLTPPKASSLIKTNGVPSSTASQPLPTT